MKLAVFTFVALALAQTAQVANDQVVANQPAQPPISPENGVANQPLRPCREADRRRVKQAREKLVQVRSNLNALTKELERTAPANNAAAPPATASSETAAPATDPQARITMARNSLATITAQLNQVQEMANQTQCGKDTLFWIIPFGNRTRDALRQTNQQLDMLEQEVERVKDTLDEQERQELAEGVDQVFEILVAGVYEMVTVCEEAVDGASKRMEIVVVA